MLLRQRTGAEHRGAHGEEDNRVDGEGGEAEPGEQEREDGVEGELRRLQHGGRGQRQGLRAQRVGEARDGEARPEDGKEAGAMRRAEVDGDAGAAAIPEEQQGGPYGQEQGPAAHLHHGGDPEVRPAMDEVDADDQRPAGAEEDEAGAECDQRRGRRPACVLHGVAVVSNHFVFGLRT